MMQHPDWKYRHAALMAISAAGEGCHKQMESYLPQIMEAVMNFVNDSVSLVLMNDSAPSERIITKMLEKYY